MNKKLVVITGASSGFGKEMAKLFNQQGYPMLLLARRIEKIKELDLDFRNVIVEKVDVTDYSAMQKAILCAEKLYGKTDLLVNNAGVMLLGDISNQMPMEWEKMLETNVLGVLNGMKIVLEEMKKRNAGTIINISSIAGYKAFKDHAAYVASKFGVHGLTEVIRQEVAPYNVRVSLVSPGAASTELLSHTTNEQSKVNYEQWKETMGGKVLDPKLVAKAVKFIYEMPQDTLIREISIASTKQEE